jgi:hypothetical protein
MEVSVVLFDKAKVDIIGDRSGSNRCQRRPWQSDLSRESLDHLIAGIQLL